MSDTGYALRVPLPEPIAREKQAAEKPEREAENPVEAASPVLEAELPVSWPQAILNIIFTPLVALLLLCSGDIAGRKRYPSSVRGPVSVQPIALLIVILGMIGALLFVLLHIYPGLASEIKHFVP